MAVMSTRDIKRKIKSVDNTKQITKAMELVSTAKLRRAKARMADAKPYFETTIETVQNILKYEKNLKHPYVTERPVKRTLYIVITSDRGLCGGYNVNAMKEVVAHIGDNKENAVIIPIGKKAVEYFEKRNYEIADQYMYISEKPEYRHAIKIANKALSMYSSGEVDAIQYIYTELVSTIAQEPRRIQLLPVQRDEAKEDEPRVYLNYEPSPEAVLSFVIPKYVESTLFGGLIESAASEQAARRIAMESATDNATEIIDELTITFNQARQAAITQEITEIVGGAEALK